MLVKLLIALPIVLVVAALAFGSMRAKRNPTTCCTVTPAERDARMRTDASGT